MGEDLPKQIQDIRKKVLIPAMKKIKKDSPHSKATVLGDKLIVDGKRYIITTFRTRGCHQPQIQTLKGMQV